MAFLKPCHHSILKDTGKSVSEALILESVNSQYDERLFIEFLVQNMLCTNNVLNVKTKTKQKQFLYSRCSELEYFSCNEQSLVILWVNWVKNESFWHRFTCIQNHFCSLKVGINQIDKSKFYIGKEVFHKSIFFDGKNKLPFEKITKYDLLSRNWITNVI